VAMQRDKQALYDVLSSYYRQDPAARVHAALARQQQTQPAPPSGVPRSQAESG